jgi:hypothetical protein
MRSDIKRLQNPGLTTAEKTGPSVQATAEESGCPEARKAGQAAISPEAAKVKQYDHETDRLRAKSAKLSERIKLMEEEWKRKRLHPTAKAWEAGKDVLNASRSLMTSADLSAIGPPRRACALVSSDHVGHGCPERCHGVFLGDGGVQGPGASQRRKNFHLYATSGLSLTEYDGRLHKQDENFMGRFWHRAFKTPLAKVTVGNVAKLVKGSERAYVAHLNQIRADLFDSMVATLCLKKGFASESEAKAIAFFVNAVTGRGSLGKYNQSSEALAPCSCAAVRRVSVPDCRRRPDLVEAAAASTAKG